LFSKLNWFHFWVFWSSKALLKFCKWKKIIC
jgi:hypothetical protein